MRYDIDSIDELVQAFGGDSKVAEWLGISQPAVAAWKIRREIPRGWHMQLFARLLREGKSVAPHVFGMDASEYEFLFARMRSRRERPAVRA